MENQSNSKNILRKDIGFFKSVPGKARYACYGLLATGIMWGLTSVALVFLALGRETLDSFDLKFFTIAILVLGIISILSFWSYRMLSKGNKTGRILAWVIIPFTLPGFPMMLIAVLIIIGLVSKDMRDYLSGSQVGG